VSASKPSSILRRFPIQVRVWTWSYFDASLYVGPWGIRFTDPRMGGRFGNGSRWCSGWAKWREVDW
jgi:hypothetical protein